MNDDAYQLYIKDYFCNNSLITFSLGVKTLEKPLYLRATAICSTIVGPQNRATVRLTKEDTNHYSHSGLYTLHFDTINQVKGEIIILEGAETICLSKSLTELLEDYLVSS